MRMTIGCVAGVALWVLLALPAAGGGPPASDALLPDGLVMVDAYQAGPGPAVGRVTAVSGQAVIVHAGSPHGYLAKVDYALYAKDLIVTRESGRLTIALNGGSTIALSAVTRLVIDRSTYDPAAKSRESFLRMGLGKARFWVKKIADARRASFRVTTATAIAGVRGSDFVIFSMAGQSEIAALEKTRLEVAGLAAPDQVVMLTDYQRTVVAAGKAPTEPESVAPDAIERLLNDVGLASLSRATGGATVINTFSRQNLTNAAVGDGSEANPGLVRRQGAQVTGTIVNRGTGKNTANIAKGKGSAANLGSIVIKESALDGSVTNRSDTDRATNVAAGKDSKANVGGIVIE